MLPMAANQTPPLKETFQAGVRDYNAAKYDVATGEFQDVIHYYPTGRSGRHGAVLPGRDRLPAEKLRRSGEGLQRRAGRLPRQRQGPAAQLRKGLALLQMNKKEAGIHELRLLIQRHPQTPEAAQARTKLNGMGVKLCFRRRRAEESFAAPDWRGGIRGFPPFSQRTRKGWAPGEQSS